MKNINDLLGLTFPPLQVSAERGQLQFFASVLGVHDPVYTDIDAARAAGHPDLLIPPTFLFSLELKRKNPYVFLHEAGFDTRQFLHGQQSFKYHSLAYAGEDLVINAEYTDSYEKKSGALKFLERTTSVTRHDEPIAELKNLLVIRELENAS